MDMRFHRTILESLLNRGVFVFDRLVDGYSSLLGSGPKTVWGVPDATSRIANPSGVSVMLAQKGFVADFEASEIKWQYVYTAGEDDDVGKRLHAVLLEAEERLFETRKATLMAQTRYDSDEATKDMQRKWERKGSFAVTVCP